jgi:hypothetical protein
MQGHFSRGQLGRTPLEMTVAFIEACFLCQEYSMGLKLATCDPENFGFADAQGCRWHGRFVARIL